MQKHEFELQKQAETVAHLNDEVRLDRSSRETPSDIQPVDAAKALPPIFPPTLLSRVVLVGP